MVCCTHSFVKYIIPDRVVLEICFSLQAKENFIYFCVAIFGGVLLEVEDGKERAMPEN